MEDLINKFNEEMKDIYFRSKKEVKYNPSRFIQLVSEKGGLQAAKQLIMKDGGTEGFARLLLENRLDLSVEAVVIKEEYKQLFTEEEIAVCHRRLREYGYLNN